MNIGVGGVRARINVTKLADTIFNNQQGLEVAMEGSVGVDAGMVGNNDR
jgi:hypothetical protein